MQREAERIGQAFLNLLQTMETAPRAVKFRVWCNYGSGTDQDVPRPSAQGDGLTFDLLLHESWPSGKALLAGIWDGTMMGGRVLLDRDLDPADLSTILEKTNTALRNTIVLLNERDKENQP